MDDLLRAAERGELDTIEDAAHMAVDEGMTNCPCGRPTCGFGKAIRKEIKRRNETTTTLTAVRIEEATYNGQVRAMRDYARELYENEWTTRLSRFIGRSLIFLLKLAGVVFLLFGITVTSPIIFLLVAIFTESAARYALRRFGPVAELISTLTNRDPRDVAISTMPISFRLGYRFGKWSRSSGRQLKFFFSHVRAHKPAPDPITDTVNAE